MEVDPPAAELPSAASHLLPFSTLGASEKKEPTNSQPETLACPQKDLFSQDISVKMASELLFKLSGKCGTGCVNTHTHTQIAVCNSRYRSAKFFPSSNCSSTAMETLERFFFLFLLR